MVATAALLYLMVKNSAGDKVQDFNFSRFMMDVNGDNVKDVTIAGTEVSGTLKKDGSKFKTTIPANYPDLYKTLQEKNVNLTIKDNSGNTWMTWLGNGLPMIVLLGLWIFFMRQMQSGRTEALSFGKSRARLLSSQQKKVTFKDVAGVDEAKEELHEIIEFLREPQKFQKLGGRIPKGVLLVGPPGTGKTLLARAIAGEANVPFFSISGSDFVEMFVGVGASRVRDLFEQGKKNAPCIIFIDEIDAVGRHRGAGLGGGHDEREQTLNQLLVEMDGFESNEGVILMGVERKSLILSEEEKKVTAYHEAGHALVASKLPHSDPLHKVTIIPRGMALGVTMQLPIDDKHNYTKEYLETEIAIMMGGRIAEEMFLNQMSTGAGNDIERATELARKMVCEFGMSDLGPLTFGKKEEQIFLGREIAQHRDYSEATAIKIDDEVRRLIGQGQKTAKGMLGEHRDTWVRIAAALLEREVLDANEIKLIMDGKELPKMTPPPKSDDGVQQVLKPEPGRPGIAKGGESPARA